MKHLLLNQQQRFETGVIATLVRGDELLTLHLIGSRHDTMIDLAERCDREGWLVQSLSTPETVARDLAGTRHYPRGARRKSPDALALPESSMLGVIGRADLFVGQ